jgi:hypothetical protein
MIGRNVGREFVPQVSYLGKEFSLSGNQVPASRVRRECRWAQYAGELFLYSSRQVMFIARPKRNS